VISFINASVRLTLLKASLSKSVLPTPFSAKIRHKAGKVALLLRDQQQVIVSFVEFRTAPARIRSNSG
jgi:hypothetical protein